MLIYYHWSPKSQHCLSTRFTTDAIGFPYARTMCLVKVVNIVKIFCCGARSVCDKTSTYMVIATWGDCRTLVDHFRLGCLGHTTSKQHLHEGNTRHLLTTSTKTHFVPKHQHTRANVIIAMKRRFLFLSYAVGRSIVYLPFANTAKQVQHRLFGAVSRLLLSCACLATVSAVLIRVPKRYRHQGFAMIYSHVGKACQIGEDALEAGDVVVVEVPGRVAETPVTDNKYNYRGNRSSHKYIVLDGQIRMISCQTTCSVQPFSSCC